MSSPQITLLAENEEYEFYRVRSFSDENISYGVDIDKVEGTCYCDCEDFRFRKQTEVFGGAKLTDIKNHCKHIKLVNGERKHRLLNYFHDTNEEVLSDG